MEFNEKLQRLRAARGLTQEELAEKLFVSRTAVSKWESGRGYPSIDSLKAIARFFNITIDELICGEEMVSLAEQSIKDTGRSFVSLVCGILDCLTLLMIFVPTFGNGSVPAVSMPLYALHGVSRWQTVAFAVIIGLLVINGFFAVILCNFDRSSWNKHRLMTGAVLSILGTALFILARQPYAGVFCFCLLVVKGIFVIKSR